MKNTMKIKIYKCVENIATITYDRRDKNNFYLLFYKNFNITVN